jgi:hypothetical protein
VTYEDNLPHLTAPQLTFGSPPSCSAAIWEMD